MDCFILLTTPRSRIEECSALLFKRIKENFKIMKYLKVTFTLTQITGKNGKKMKTNLSMHEVWISTSL